MMATGTSTKLATARHVLMLSRIKGTTQTEKASQEQVSDKAAAGVTALARLVQIVRKDSGSKVYAPPTVCSTKMTQVQSAYSDFTASGCLAELPVSCIGARSSFQRS